MMRALSLSELSAPLRGRMVDGDVEFSGASIDSRAVRPGDLFVAIKGASHDGHDYVEQARLAGAAGAVVSTPVDAGLPLLLVADTAAALAGLGAFNRSLYAGPLVAITGSNGKTTAKNLACGVLSQRGETMATAGNYNNEIGVPLTLLRLSPSVRFAVVEMGAARVGDIAHLCRLGRPTVALLLNAMQAHLETFGSVEDIARGKGEIFDGLREGDVAIVNADQVWAADWRARAGAATIIDFGLREPAAVTARDFQSRGNAGSRFVLVTPRGEYPVELQLPGRHNLANALAAACVGLACELSLEEIAAGLASVAPAGGRLVTRLAASGATVIDDCYNANPGSMRAAIDLLAQAPARRTAVLGAMRELGADSERLHGDLGIYAREAGIERLWGVGEELRASVTAFGPGGRLFADHAELLPALSAEVGAGDTLLVKGSRGAAMEVVVDALLGGGEA